MVSQLASLSPEAKELVVKGLCLNTTASLSPEKHPDGAPKVIGNKTEGALLLLLQVRPRTIDACEDPILFIVRGR